MARHVRRDDMVIVTSGDDKGKQGRILRVIPGDHPNLTKVVVEGINVRTRHMRPSQANPQGGTVQKELPIHVSKVSPVVDGKPTRVRFEIADNGAKRRIAVKGGGKIGPDLKKAR